MAIRGFTLPHDADVDIDLACEILQYFVRSPHAADTVQGIARWRLLDEAIYRNLDQVTKAISWLVTQGMLVRVPTNSSECLFHLNEQFAGETKKFLASKTRGKTGAKKRPRKREP